MSGGACSSQADPRPFLSCALHMQFELPHTSYKFPKSVNNLRAAFPGFFLCRLLPAFSSHKHPSPAKLLGCWQGPWVRLPSPFSATEFVAFDLLPCWSKLAQGWAGSALCSEVHWGMGRKCSVNCAGQDRLLCGCSNSRGLDGVTQAVTSPPMFLSAPVGRVGSLAASSLPALLTCDYLPIFACGFHS